MKVNTLQRFLYTASYYDFRTLDNGTGTGNTFEHFYAGDIKVMIYPTDNGDLFVYTQSPMRIGAIIRNIRDVSGVVVTGASTRPAGYDYRVTSAEPVLNAFGFVDAMRYVVVRTT